MAQLMRTSNPVLNEKRFEGFAALGEGMTLQGTVNKTGLLLLFAVASASWTWHLFMQSHSAAAVVPWLWIGTIGGFVCALITVFKKEWSPVTAPVYALLEGLALGGISAVLELRFPGIAIQAVSLTFGTLLRPPARVSIRPDPCDTEFPAGHSGRHWRHHGVLSTAIRTGFLWRSLYFHQRVRPHRHRVQPDCRRYRRAQPGARFRLYREWRAHGRSQIHGVVRRVRDYGHAGLAVP